MYPDLFVVHFLSFFSRPRGLRLLDAGCGAGRNTQYLSEQGLGVTAVDVSLGQLRKAVALVPDAGFAGASVMALPFADHRFDAAVCTSVLEYLPDDEAAQAAAELQRVLAPRGKLLVVAAAAEGSETGYGPASGTPPGAVARLTSKQDIARWFDRCETIELLHLRLEEPATAPVRAQWALIARRR